MGAAPQVSLSIDLKGRGCSCGDVGEVLHDNTFACVSASFKALSEAAVRMNKALQPIPDTPIVHDYVSLMGEAPTLEVKRLGELKAEM